MAYIDSIGERVAGGIGARPHDGRTPVGGAFKRGFDIAGALALIVFLSPFIILVAAIMRLTDSGPIVFAHRRIGFDGRPFMCLKFRTMVTNSAEVLADLLANDPAAAAEWRDSQKLRNDPRITGLGRFLRATSLDELPQIINVLRGEMSLVGPRPVVADELARYGANVTAYQAARPGVTGLWQVSGRSDCGYDERVAFDVDYVSRWSPVNDVAILLRTVRVVLFRQGSC